MQPKNLGLYHGVNRRHKKRWAVTWPARLIQGPCEWPCTILNISDRGAKLEINGEIAPGAPVVLSCKKFGHLHGYLKWRRGVRAGVAFEASPAEVAAVLEPALPGIDQSDQMRVLTGLAGSFR